MATLGAFIIVLGIIIFVHEFGHFITAKAFGIRVFVFSFGFGKRLFGFQWGDTDCRVSLVPLGGYVKLEGEPDDPLTESATEDVRVLDDGTMVRVPNPNYFTNRPRWQRFLVYVAGPVMNVVLTLSVFTVLHMVGFGVEGARYDRAILGGVEPGSMAATAGFQVGDEILAIDGRRIETWEDAGFKILLRPNALLKFRIRRGDAEQDIEVRSSTTTEERLGEVTGFAPLVRIGVLTPHMPAEEAGLRTDDAILAIGDKPIKTFSDLPPLVQAAAGKPLALKIWREGQVFDVTVVPREGRIGVGNKVVIKRFAFPGAVREAGLATWGLTKLTFNVIKGLFKAELSVKTMSGPLGIAQQSGEAIRQGWLTYLNLIAAISLQVGIMNLFPLAPLDGGHLAILLGEGVLRRDFSINVKTWIMNAGAAAIFLLIGVVLYSDLSKTSWLGKYLP